MDAYTERKNECVNFVLNHVYEVRGIRIMTDFDLSTITGLSTEEIHQRYKDELSKEIPLDIGGFQLSKKEWRNLRQLILTKGDVDIVPAENNTPFAYDCHSVSYFLPYNDSVAFFAEDLFELSSWKNSITSDRVLYLTSSTALSGALRIIGANVNKDKSIISWTNELYSFDSCLLPASDSLTDINKVTEGDLFDSLVIKNFIDVIQFPWKKVVVWRFDNNLSEDILMMLIAKFAPKDIYPLYEVVLDWHIYFSSQMFNYVRDLYERIDSEASLLTPFQIDYLTEQYDRLLIQDTGMRIKDEDGEIVNVGLDYFYPIVFPIKRWRKWNKVRHTFIEKGFSDHMTHNILWRMWGKNLFHVKNKKTGKEMKYTRKFWYNSYAWEENAIIYNVQNDIVAAS